MTNTQYIQQDRMLQEQVLVTNKGTHSIVDVRL